MATPSLRHFQLTTLGKRGERRQQVVGVKFDGYRMQADIAGITVPCYSRNGHGPAIRNVVPPLSSLTKGTVPIGGEDCAMDEQGDTNFALLKASLAGRTPVVFQKTVTCRCCLPNPRAAEPGC